MKFSYDLVVCELCFSRQPRSVMHSPFQELREQNLISDHTRPGKSETDQSFPVNTPADQPHQPM